MAGHAEVAACRLRPIPGDGACRKRSWEGWPDFSSWPSNVASHCCGATGEPCYATRLAWARPTRAWAFLREFANQRSDDPQRARASPRALIVYPSQLQDNWSADRFAEWGIMATTVSMESLAQLGGHRGGAVTRSAATAPRRVEAVTKTSTTSSLWTSPTTSATRRTKRYRALMEIIRGGKPDTRVVLMTATPINNSVWDLYHQLMLITRGRRTHGMRGEGRYPI